jgi:hypothetical protein
MKPNQDLPFVTHREVHYFGCGQSDLFHIPLSACKIINSGGAFTTNSNRFET